MNIQFSAALNQFNPNNLLQSLNNLGEYTVKSFKFLQRENPAVISVLATNIIFTTLIIKIVDYIDDELNNFTNFTWYRNLSDSTQFLSTGVLVSLGVSLINLALYKGTKPALSPVVFTALAITTTCSTILSYLILRDS
jgi:hypothetical protein